MTEDEFSESIVLLHRVMSTTCDRPVSALSRLDGAGFGEKERFLCMLDRGRPYMEISWNEALEVPMVQFPASSIDSDGPPDATFLAMERKTAGNEAIFALTPCLHWGAEQEGREGAPHRSRRILAMIALANSTMQRTIDNVDLKPWNVMQIMEQLRGLAFSERARTCPDRRRDRKRASGVLSYEV
jgi:hypothetical protein